MNASEKLETSIPNPEQQQLPKNPEVGFEIDDEQKFEQHRDQILGDVESRASQTKEDGIARLDRTSNSYELPEEDITSIRQESQVDVNLKSNSEEIDQLTQSTAEQIKRVGESPKSEQAPETQEGNIEKEKTIESFQEKRGAILTNVLTSETVNSGLNLVPFAGGGKMLVESISGKELSGHKLSGKERIIHGAIGAGSLALDFTGIGEMSKAGVLAGRSVGLVEKVGAGLATKGAVRSARVFEKTAEFMVKHPDLTAKAELYADSKIRGVVTQIKDYQREARPVEEPQVSEASTPETQNVQAEVAPDMVQEPVKEAEVQKIEVEDTNRENKEQKEDEPASELNVAEQNQTLSPDNSNVNFARTVESANPERLRIQEQAKNLRASREITDGKLFYAALKGDKEVFSAANKKQMETDLAMAANKLAEYQLSVKQGEPVNISLEESLKRDVEWRENVLAGGKLESDNYMKDTKNGLKRIDGNFVKTEYPITDVLSRPYRNIKGEMQTGLIDALRTNYEKYRKEFGANALAETNYLREAQGVGLAALEAGDLNTARQAFSFTEVYSPMAGETKKQFEQIIGKMKPEAVNQLLADLGITSFVESSIMEKTERPAVREAGESFKREREISQPIIEEARRKRDLIMEKRGLLQMPEEEFDTYFNSKDFEVISDLKQQNVGDCYLVASIHSMSRSPNFEMMVRSSMKRLPDGSWQVKVPLLSEEAKLITITPEDLLPQKNEQFLKAKRKGGIIPDLRRKLMPLKGKEGLQVLEAAYMKSNFGKVDRLASEGGVAEHALLSFMGDNFQKDGFIVPAFMMEKAKDNPGALENPKFLSAYQKHLDSSKHFLENFDPEVYIATASSKPGSDSNAYKVEGTNISLAHGHAYSITRVDTKKNMITLANPWDTSKPIDLTFQQFGESFWEVDAVRIDNAKLMKNMQRIDK